MEPEDELLTPGHDIATENDDQQSDTGEHYDYSPDEIAADEEGVSTVDDYPSPPVDVSALDDQALVSEMQRRKLMPPYAATEGTFQQAPDPRLAQIVELSYTNPAMAEALRLQIAEERAEARIMEWIGPTIGPIATREAIQNSGLGEHGQQYLSETFSRMPELDASALMANPLTRDVLTRAARQFESERARRPAPRYESAASEAPTLSAEDWKAIRDFERMTGDRVDSDVIRSAKRGL